MQTLAEVGSQGEVVDLNSVTEATLSQDGQIILTSEDGHGKHITCQCASTNIIYACHSVHNNFHYLIFMDIVCMFFFQNFSFCLHGKFEQMEYGSTL